MVGNLWLYVAMSLTLAGTGVLTGAALSSSWFHIACGDGEWLGIGLWTACRPSANMTVIGMGKDGCGQVDNVLLDGHIPAWMRGTRILAMCGALSAGITFLLMVAFCFLPPSASLHSAHGLGGCGLGTAAFCVSSLLDSHVGRAALRNMVDPAVCGAGTGVEPVLFSRGYHLTVGGMFLCILSGMAAAAARMVCGSRSLSSRSEDGVDSGGEEGGDSLSQQPPQKIYLKFRGRKRQSSTDSGPRDLNQRKKSGTNAFRL